MARTRTKSPGHDAAWWAAHPESRKKASDSKRGRPAPRARRPRSAETRQRASESTRRSNAEKRARGERLGRRPAPGAIVKCACAQCGAEFEFRPHPKGRQKFCSKGCAGLWATMHGGNYRRKALRQLEHVCQRCGQAREPADLLVHHADENRANNALGNLQIVCVPCHTIIHADLHKRSRRAYGDRAVQRGVIEILKGLKLDLNDKNLQATPQRVSRMLLEMFEGLFHGGDVADILSTSFPSTYDGLIVHNGMVVFSMCPHHLLPVEYDISVGYVASRTVGLSKLSRAVELLAKRPVLQETLTRDIADALAQHLQATGIAVVVRGKHACMRVRGVRALEEVVTTSEARGVFRESPAARAEVFGLFHKRSAE